jgi:acetyl-CoA C-acetyltransferase
MTTRAALVGFHEYPAERPPGTTPRGTGLEEMADLALLALADAGLTMRDVDGLNVTSLYEADGFVPVTASEYLGLNLRYGEVVDLGGATPAGMVWRAASAIAKGVCEVVLCIAPRGYAPRPIEDAHMGASILSYSTRFGSPQAEFDLPYGHDGQNQPYAMIANRYGYEYGYDPRAMARLVVHQRRNACANPAAIHFGKPITEDDVLESRMIARPLHILEIVMPVRGGAAVVVVSDRVARRCRHRPAWITGHGEALSYKSPQYARDILRAPLASAAPQAFAMAGLKPSDMDAAQIYDCYSIAVLMALEAAGFCGWGEGMAFLREHDMSFEGDFPLNTHGGQLGFGQAGMAGGMSQVVEAIRQLSGRADARQLARCDKVFVSGNGGIMSEQTALVLEGE